MDEEGDTSKENEVEEGKKEKGVRWKREMGE